MTNHETVHPDASVVLEFSAAVAQQLPRDIPIEVMAGWNKDKKALGKVLRAALMPPDEEGSLVTSELAKPALLELVGTADCEAPEAFKPSDFFTQNGQQPDGIWFWLGRNFKANFLSGTGKIQLNAYELREGSRDDLILMALGGNDRAKSCLAFMAQLIKAQPNGESGLLLTDGWPNTFYIEDDRRVLWAVRCFWRPGEDEWVVEADPVTGSDFWNSACRFFSQAVLAA